MSFDFNRIATLLHIEEKTRPNVHPKLKAIWQAVMDELHETASRIEDPNKAALEQGKPPALKPVQEPDFVQKQNEEAKEAEEEAFLKKI